MHVLMYEPVGQGGMRHYSTGLARGLKHQGVEVTLLTPQLADGANKYLVDVDALAVLRDPGRSVTKLNWLFDRTHTALYNGIMRARVANTHDICHLQNFSFAVDWFLLSRITVPIVLTVHDVRLHQTRWWETDWALRRIYNTADMLIVHSEHNRRELEKSGLVKNPSRIVVVPHGFDTRRRRVCSKSEARKKLGFSADSRIALSFGTIRVDKGIDIAIRALALAPEWTLVIAGPGSDDLVMCYRHLSEELEVENRIVWRVGFVPDEDVDMYFNAADIAVLSYRPSFESQSGVLFQAYRNGTPVVVTNVGSLGDTVVEDRSGVVVNSERPDEIAAALNSDIGTPGVEILARKYDWEQVAIQTKKVYEQTVRLGKRGLR